MFKMFLTVVLLLVSVMTACATPTPTVTGLAWDAYTDANGKGFWIYWKDKGNGALAYNDVNRTQITDVTKVSVLISAIVAATHPASMCFVLTAYDAAGNESGFSNEVCGFIGMPSVGNVRGQ
jgi:hypothetical protein